MSNPYPHNWLIYKGVTIMVGWFENGRTAPGVCGNGFVPLSHSGNVVTRIRIHTYTVGWRAWPSG